LLIRQRKQQLSFVKHPVINIFSPQTLVPRGVHRPVTREEIGCRKVLLPAVVSRESRFSTAIQRIVPLKKCFAYVKYQVVISPFATLNQNVIHNREQGADDFSEEKQVACSVLFCLVTSVFQELRYVFLSGARVRLN
jgi:hypothetical protein